MSIFYSLCNKSSEGTNVEMKGVRAESNALGHSSCGRCPHPDIVTNLCTSKKQWIAKNTYLPDKIKSLPKSCSRLTNGRSVLTEFTSFEAMACADFTEIRASSEPATTRTGRSSTDLSKSAALFDGRTVENESRPTS